MLRRYPWLSLLMLLLVGTSTAYAVTDMLRGDWVMFRNIETDTRIYEVPHPTEAEVSDIRRRLAPRIEVEEPLLVNG